MQHDKSLIWPANLGCYPSRCRVAWRPVPPARTTCLDWPGSGPKRWAGGFFPARARDRQRAHQNPPAGRCLLPVTDHKMVKHHVQLDQASSAADREQEAACLPSGHAGPASGRPALNPGRSWPILRETSSASCARRRRSSV